MMDGPVASSAILHPLFSILVLIYAHDGTLTHSRMRSNNCAELTGLLKK
jgi:hypothetical protein